MDHEPINLLNSLNAEETLTGGPAKPKRSVLFWSFVLISVFIGIFIVRSIVNTESEEYTDTLSPRKLSFIETVKNFIFHPDNILIGQDEDRINILLLGIGGSGHDGPYLSDTNIIVSLKPSTNEVALISVPRDLGALVGTHGWRKINSADAFGEAERPGAGGEYARQVFENTFRLKIPYFLRVDFTAFQELIDKLGGINVNVPTAFTDASYPGPNFSYTTVHFDAGVQLMDGEHALSYSRSRHGNAGEGSDFARSRRQQLIIEAVKEKMLSLGTYTNPGKIKNVYDSLKSHVSTNLNIAELSYL
ncbi:MAG: LCP family protein, partial [Patescibacteria group bacterium]